MPSWTWYVLVAPLASAVATYVGLNLFLLQTVADRRAARRVWRARRRLLLGAVATDAIYALVAAGQVASLRPSSPRWLVELIAHTPLVGWAVIGLGGATVLKLPALLNVPGARSWIPRDKTGSGPAAHSIEQEILEQNQSHEIAEVIWLERATRLMADDGKLTVSDVMVVLRRRYPEPWNNPEIPGNVRKTIRRVARSPGGVSDDPEDAVVLALALMHTGLETLIRECFDALDVDWRRIGAA